jgi:tetratricopeptide (TPR) repeat protein
LSENPEAVKHYQQAVYQLHSGTTHRHLEAYTNLIEAVRLDPGFLDAHYMMFEANFSVNNLPPYYNQLTNSRVVVAKLRELNPNSAQYHTANSLVKWLEWKFEEAIQEAALAIKLNPRFVRAHGIYASEVLEAHGDTETARREYQIAERLDPSDVTIQAVEAEPYFVKRKFDLAIQQLNKALELEPRMNLHYQLGHAYEAAGQYEKALDEFESNALAIGLDPEQTRDWYIRLRSELRAKGPRGWWQAQADGNRNHPYFNPWWTARYCARVGYTNDALSLLDQAYTNHDGELTSLLIDDCWDPLRSDPRFKELVKKVGLRPKSAP